VHPDEDKILKYVWHELTENEEILIGEHLADCESCVQIAQAEAQSQHLWDDWQAQKHGEFFWKKFIRQTMTRAQETAQSELIKGRLQNWFKLWNGKVGSMIRFVEKGSGEFIEVITDFPRGIMAKTGSLTFAGLSPGRDRVQTNSFKIESAENIQVQLLLDDINRNLLIRIPTTFTNPPLVILAPQNDEPQTARPQKIDSAWYSLAFSGIPSGSWVLLFEPAQRNRVYTANKVVFPIGLVANSVCCSPMQPLSQKQ